jgi:DNA-binding MarR family transcriptional regulator
VEVIRSSNDRPEADPLPLALLRELRLLGAEITRMDHAVAEALGIGVSDVHCLEILERLGPMPASRLAREAGLSRSATTAAMDRLEREGYVRRRSDPSDGRLVVVELGPAANRQQEVFRPLVEASLELHRGYPAEQLRLLAEFIRRTRGLLAAHAQRVRGSAWSRPRRIGPGQLGPDFKAEPGAGRRRTPTGS